MLNPFDIKNIAQAYINANTPEQQQSLESELMKYDGPIDAVLKALHPPSKNETRKGEIREQHFTASELGKTYPDDLLYFYVPEDYDPEQSTGLFIFMHGGDAYTPREKAGVITSHPTEDDTSYGLRPSIEQAPFITVAPSALWDKTCHKRWNLPEADMYIDAIIKECSFRFNIDQNRIFLGGHSMGGFGAFHLCQRLNDRIAGGLFSAGAWKTSDFRALKACGVFLIHGSNDCAPGASPVKGQGTRQNEWTGVSFARAAEELMKRDDIQHTYHEHEGGHAFADGETGLQEFILATQSQKRDPYPKQVTAISPRGCWLIDPVTETPHSYWVSINEIGSNEIELDTINLTGPNIAKTAEELKEQGYQLTKTSIKGGRIQATLMDDNRIEIKTENVHSFSLWLHEKMIDFNKPLTVIVNGNEKQYTPKPSLCDTLRAYKRKSDWGLEYLAELVIKVGP